MSELRDRRLPPFAWLSRAAIDRLLEAFEGRERAMALSVYTALAVLSSEQRRGDHEGIVATRRDLASIAGVSDRTVDEYTNRLRRAGLLAVERRRDGGLNLPNIWALVEPGQDVGGGELDSPPTEQASPGVANAVHHGGEQGSPLKKKEEGETAKAVSLKRRAGAKPVDQSVPPASLPEPLLAVLDETRAVILKVYEERGGDEPSVRGIGLALARFPDRDHVTVAHDLEHWAIAGPGQAKPVKDWARTFATFLGRAPKGSPQRTATPDNVVHLQPESVRRSNSWLRDFYNADGVKEEYR